MKEPNYRLLLLLIGLVGCSASRPNDTPAIDASTPKDAVGRKEASVSDGPANFPDASAGCEARRQPGLECRVDQDCCSLRCEPPFGAGWGTCALGPYGAPCDETSPCAQAPCLDGVCRRRELGEPCVADNDCNSDLCDGGACACAPSAGDRCRTSADCCDDMQCSAGRCALAVGAPCAFNDECLGGSCAGGRCACVAARKPCTEDADCCSGPCRSGVCALGADAPCQAGDVCLRVDAPSLGVSGCQGGVCLCGVFGGDCALDTDCCSGRCLRPGPSHVGRCTHALPGDRCAMHLDCAYSEHTYGHPACGPDARCACSPKGGVCRTEAHCCEGPCEQGLCAAGPEPVSCVPFGKASVTGGDCCWGLIAPGGPGSACCGAPGRPCTESYECCTNTCGADGKCP